MYPALANPPYVLEIDLHWHHLGNLSRLVDYGSIRPQDDRTPIAQRTGDIDIEETKQLVTKWFGEIPSGPEVQPMQPMPVQLEQTKSLYFKDNFAN